jgi:hypothetical protein
MPPGTNCKRVGSSDQSVVPLNRASFGKSQLRPRRLMDAKPGVEDEFRRATFLRETHSYPSWLRYCVSKVVSTSTGLHLVSAGNNLLGLGTCACLRPPSWRLPYSLEDPSSNIKWELMGIALSPPSVIGVRHWL